MGFVNCISKKSYIWYVVSFSLSVSSLCLSYFYIDLFHFVFHQKMKLTEGSKAVENWIQPPFLQSMSFYLFNWTNPEEFGEHPPNLVELGPFKYKMIHKKINLEFNDNDTLTYNVLRHWYFDSDGSNGSEADNITTFNPILTSAAHFVRYAGFLRQRALAFGVNAYRTKRYMTKTAREYIFDGISDPLLTAATYFQSFTKIEVPFQKFGWFSDRNDTYHLEGTFNVGSGILDMNNYSRVQRWDKGTGKPFFDGECGIVDGSTGDLFPQRLNKTDVIEFFLSDICRSIKLYYKEEAEVSGILGYKFVADSQLVDNGTLDEANSCFCTGKCSRIGVLNVTNCFLGVPAFASFPHFLHADQYYLNSVNGLKPDEKKHEFYIIVEPNTGTPLDITIRFQGNILTMPYKYVSILANVPSIYFPMFWVEARMLIPKEVVLELKLGLFALNYGSVVLLCMAAIFIIPFILALAKIRSKSSSSKTQVKVPAVLEQPLLIQKT